MCDGLPRSLNDGPNPSSSSPSVFHISRPGRIIDLPNRLWRRHVLVGPGILLDKTMPSNVSHEYQRVTLDLFHRKRTPTYNYWILISYASEYSTNLPPGRKLSPTTGPGLPPILQAVEFREHTGANAFASC
jgi:hypothetical protein